MNKVGVNVSGSAPERKPPLARRASIVKKSRVSNFWKFVTSREVVRYLASAKQGEKHRAQNPKWAKLVCAQARESPSASSRM